MNFDSLNYRNNSKIGRTILIGNEVNNAPLVNRCSQDFITFSNILTIIKVEPKA